MFSIAALLFLIASQASASGIPHLPARTAIADDKHDARGWTPMPTERAKLFLKRQADYEATPLCGFANGNASQILSCTSSEDCAFNTYSSAFGCCNSVYTSDDTPYYTGCGFYTACLDSTEPCDASCQANTAIQRCTESAFPRCVKYSYPLADYTFTNFGCFDVVAEPTPVVGVSISVEGFDLPEETGSVDLSSSSSRTVATSRIGESGGSSSSSEEVEGGSSTATTESTRAFTRTQASAGITSQAFGSAPTTSTAGSNGSTGAAVGLEARLVALAGVMGSVLYLSLYAFSPGV